MGKIANYFAVEVKRNLFEKELMQIYYEIVGYPKK